MKKKGSFTIEAALLIPAIFVIVLLVMHLSFFLYNREAVTVIASEAALMGVQMEKEGKNEIKQKVTSFVREETEKKLIFISKVDSNVKITMKKVEIGIDFIQKTPLKELHCKVVQKMSRLDPASFLWGKESLQRE